jgi:hypothetical protein
MLASGPFLLLVAEMRAFSIAAIIAMLAVPAHAQMGHGKGGGKLGQRLTDASHNAHQTDTKPITSASVSGAH